MEGLAWKIVSKCLTGLFFIAFLFIIYWFGLKSHNVHIKTKGEISARPEEQSLDHGNPIDITVVVDSILGVAATVFLVLIIFGYFFS